MCFTTYSKYELYNLTETAYFFHNSAKRQSFLEKVIDKKSGVVNMCFTTYSKYELYNLTETAYFFHNSAKRQSFLEKVIDKKSGVVKVKDLCRTRWVYRHEAYENFKSFLLL